MQVVITKDQLEKVHACTRYLNSPEWDAGQQALVYSDWEATIARLLSSRRGTMYLEFFVVHELVPMTKSQFLEAKKAVR
jgi:hypothetical protein